jgi:hypothetical protein
MRLDDLLHEFQSSALPSVPDIDQVLAKADRQRAVRRSVAGLGVAAAAVFAFIVTRPQPQATHPIAVAALNTPMVTSAATTTTHLAPTTLTIPPALTTAPKRRSTRTERVPAAQLFYELPDARYLPAPESLHVVRVAVSEERLYALGWLDRAPRNTDRQMDLLLGQDGLARAIRMVDYSFE